MRDIEDNLIIGKLRILIYENIMKHLVKDSELVCYSTIL